MKEPKGEILSGKTEKEGGKFCLAKMFSHSVKSVQKVPSCPRNHAEKSNFRAMIY